MVWLVNRLNVVRLESIRVNRVYLFEKTRVIYVRGIGSIIPGAETF